MATYVIGDLQGCRADFDRLLGHIAFNQDRDRVWLVGDLVSRGPDSLGTLRRVHDLRDNVTCVLGNHDLHLLALRHAARAGQKPRKAPEPDLKALLDAKDSSALLDWLQALPLMHVPDDDRQPVMIHAGLPPQWDIHTAQTEARAVEHALRTSAGTVFEQMYGNAPAHWSEVQALAQQAPDRLRFAINCFTRLRYCRRDGTLNLKAKGTPGEQADGAIPWFEAPNAAWRQRPVAFGHWSTLGQVRWPENNVIGLDTGCVWGGSLTALRLDDDSLHSVPCPMHRTPG